MDTFTNNMKLYTTIKTGYSSGVYGCSGEYFTTIIITDNKQDFFHHKGLYGSEERINKALKEKGYTFFYTCAGYGKIKSREYPKGWYMLENEAINYINEKF